MLLLLKASASTFSCDPTQIPHFFRVRTLHFFHQKGKMSQRKMGGSLMILAGMAAMILSIRTFLVGSGNNDNLLNVILYLCCGAIFFFWGINVLMPQKHVEQENVPTDSSDNVA